MPNVANITFACEEPEALARFWAYVLDYEIQGVPQEFIDAWTAAGRDIGDAAAIIDPSGKGPRLFFQRKPKRPEVEGTHLPLHLDVMAEDREALVERLLQRGASFVETKTEVTGEFVSTWTVLRDPEGNGFCVE